MYIALTGELWGLCCEYVGEIDHVIMEPYCIYTMADSDKPQDHNHKEMWKILNDWLFKLYAYSSDPTATGFMYDFRGIIWTYSNH